MRSVALERLHTASVEAEHDIASQEVFEIEASLATKLGQLLVEQEYFNGANELKSAEESKPLAERVEDAS